MSNGVTWDEFFQQHMVQSRPLSIRETAKLMRRRSADVRAMLKNGTLPYIQRAKGRYILIEDIRRILRQEAEAAKAIEERKSRHKTAIDTSGLNPLLRKRLGLA